ncbi:MAG: hypothetical protein H0W83_16110 [Planctomycetes bacterium]|nr:hypothetical protein [Planctomycetota bacterium]
MTQPHHRPVRPRRPAQIAVMVLAAALACVWSGCEDSREPIYHAKPSPKGDSTERDIAAEIANLAKGKDPNDIDASALYDEAVSKLTGRGQKVESRIIDALRTSTDWGIRMGCIEVLESTGSKACVEHLIAALLDDEPLVAFHANKTLEELTRHKEIPEAGKPTAANGLPSVPARDPAHLEMNAEQKLWSAYQREHRTRLHDAWDAWWTDNKSRTKVE